MIEDILSKSPAEIQRIYDNDMSVLKSGSYAEKRDVAKRHVLKVLQVPEEAVNRAVLKALKDRPEYGIESVNDIASAPSFEVARYDPTGMNVTYRGHLVVAHKVLGDKVVKIFYNIFHDDERRKRAALGQQFLAEAVDYIRASSSDPVVHNLLDEFKPVKPVYSKKNIIANVFLDGQDLHSVMKDCSVDEKYVHLRKTALFDYLVGHYSRELLETRRWSRAFPHVDHNPALIESAIARCAMRNPPKSKIKGVSGFSFSQGDGLPSNMMVSFAPFSEDGKKLLGKDGVTAYTPVDFEFASVDFPEATIVQRLNKSGVYGPTGLPYVLSNGRTVEDVLLQDISAFMKRVDPNFDVSNMCRRFGVLKAENYLLWAARYKGFAESPIVPNQEESLLLSKYFYTLFAKSNYTRAFPFARELFGFPLSDEQMLEVYDKYRPDTRTLSLLNIDVPFDWEKRLETLVNNYNKRSFWNKVKKGAVGVAAGLALLAGGLGYNHFANRVGELSDKVQETEKWKKYEEKIKIIRLAQHNASPRSSSEVLELRRLGAWKEYFGDSMTAVAAYLNADATFKAIKEGGSTDWESVKEHIDSEVFCAMTGTWNTVDNWVWQMAHEQNEKVLKIAREMEEKYDLDLERNR